MSLGVTDVAPDRERSAAGFLDRRDRLVDGARQAVGVRVDGPRRTDDGRARGAASPIARPLPMPRDAPVTMTTRPVRSAASPAAGLAAGFMGGDGTCPLVIAVPL